MPLPALLRFSRVPVAAASAEPLGGAAPQSGLLHYETQRQLHTYWCWAAVAASVAGFYAADTMWTQCRIADAEIGRGDCCEEEGGGACNVPWYLHRALARVGHLDRWSDGSLTFFDVAATIDAGDPLCVRIAWLQGGAHFVALRGYRKGEGENPDVVTVGDPLYGNSHIEFAEFCDRYRGVGTWTHSYFCA